MVAHAYNLTTQETEVQGLKVQGQLRHIVRPFLIEEFKEKLLGK